MLCAFSRNLFGWFQCCLDEMCSASGFVQIKVWYCHHSYWLKIAFDACFYFKIYLNKTLFECFFLTINEIWYFWKGWGIFKRSIEWNLDFLDQKPLWKCFWETQRTANCCIVPTVQGKLPTTLIWIIRRQSSARYLELVSLCLQSLLSKK